MSETNVRSHNSQGANRLAHTVDSLPTTYPSAKVPFLKLSGFDRGFDRKLKRAITRELRGDDFVLGETVKAFERSWATYCGSNHAVGVGSGLAAIELALRAVGVRYGDEVLVPANTFIATWMAVSNIGAVPVPVPTSRIDYNLVPELVGPLISDKTRAILPVHLYGFPAKLEAIQRTAAQHGLAVVEDAAQAHGARYQGQRIGAHSDAVAWSFYPGKNLGGIGDGGAVTTNNPDIAKEVQALRNYGSLTKYHHDTIGTNSRLDSVQASALNVKLQYLDRFNTLRRRQSELYRGTLAPLEHSTESLRLPPADTTESVSAWHLFVVRVTQRAKVRAALIAHGIETGVHYPVPPGLQGAYAQKYEASVTSDTIADSNSLLSLPIGPHLSDSQVAFVSRTLLTILRDLGEETVE